MNDSNKKKLIIASIIAILLIVGLLIYYFVYVKDSTSNESENSKDMNFLAIEESKETTEYKNETNNEITSGEAVDSNTNNLITAQIKQETDLLENVSVANVKVYQNNNNISSDLMNQESTYNGNSNARIDTSNSDTTDNGAIASQDQGNSVNIVLDLTILTESKDSDEVNREVETTSNYLAETIAGKMPDVNSLIINYYVNNSNNIRAEFTYLRSGNNLFLQEFTMT